jgi:hypothetical protein
MTLLPSFIHHLRTHRARRRQVRNALQMLTVSGVVRASHIEPRYFSQATPANARHHRAKRPVAVPSNEPSATSLWQRPITIDFSRVRQWINAVRPT